MTDVLVVSTLVLAMRTTLPPDPVAATLFGKLRRELLALCFAQPGQRYYVRELVRLLGASPGALQRELGQLTEVGLLRRSRRGRQVYYEANESSPIFEELRSILDKTVGIADVLRAALAPLADRIDGAMIFGSVAAGTAGSGSDVDVLVVGEVELSEVSDALAAAERRLGREVIPVVYTAAEFGSRIETRGHFVTSVRRGPMVAIMGKLPDGA